MKLSTKWTRWRGKRGQVHIKQAAGRLQVASPYHEAFNIAARSGLYGRWRPRSRLWSFPLSKQDEVIAAIRRIYGEDAIYKENE